MLSHMTQEQRSSVNNNSVLCCVYTGSTSGHAAPPPQNKHTHTHTQTHTPNTHTHTHTQTPALSIYLSSRMCWDTGIQRGEAFGAWAVGLDWVDKGFCLVQGGGYGHTHTHTPGSVSISGDTQEGHTHHVTTPGVMVSVSKHCIVCPQCLGIHCIKFRKNSIVSWN